MKNWHFVRVTMDVVKTSWRQVRYPLFLFAIGAYGIVASGWSTVQLLDGHASKNWATVVGTITQSEATTSRSTHRPMRKRRSFNLTYVYAVDGHRFEGHRTWAGGAVPGESFATEHPPGTKVDVFYAPNNPTKSVLFQGVSAYAIFNAAIGYFMILLSGVLGYDYFETRFRAHRVQ